jgi:hypothetical protein
MAEGISWLVGDCVCTLPEALQRSVDGSVWVLGWQGDVVIAGDLASLYHGNPASELKRWTTRALHQLALSAKFLMDSGCTWWPDY